MALLATLIACKPGGTEPLGNNPGGNFPLRIKTIAKDCDGDNSWFADTYTFSYDEHGRLLKIESLTNGSDDPLIALRSDGKIFFQAEVYDVSQEGGRVKSTQGTGNRTYFTYDASGLLTEAQQQYASGPNSNDYEVEATDRTTWSDGKLTTYEQVYSDNSAFRVSFKYTTAAKNPFAPLGVDPLPLILRDFLNNDFALWFEACRLTGQASTRFPTSFTVYSIDPQGDPFGTESFAINVTATNEGGYPTVITVWKDNSEYTYTLTYEGKADDQAEKPQSQGLTLAAATFGTAVAGERGVYLEFVSSTDEAVYRKDESFVGFEIYLWVTSSGSDEQQDVPVGTFNIYGARDDYRKFGPNVSGNCFVTQWLGTKSVLPGDMDYLNIEDKGNGKYRVSLHQFIDYSITFSWEGPITLSPDGYIHFERPM